MIRGRFETVFFWMNSHVTIHNVTVISPRGSPNTDGINPGEFSPLKLRISYNSVFVFLVRANFRAL